VSTVSNSVENSSEERSRFSAEVLAFALAELLAADEARPTDARRSPR